MEYIENSSNAIAAINFNKEKEEPPQNSNILHLIREHYGIKVCEKQKQNMKDTMLELLEVCRQKEFYCMHNDVDDLIESALNSKLLSINLRSQRLNKKKQEVKNIVEQLTKRGTQPKYSLSIGYENLSTTSEMESDEIIKSSVEKLVPIQSEYKGIFDNTSDLPVCKDHYEIVFDSNNDDTSSDDDDFEDIKYVEASCLDSELVSLEEENDGYQEEKEFDLENILQIQDVILRKKLLSINRLIADIEFLNDNSTLDRVLKSSFSFPIFEKSDNSLSYLDNSLPKFKTFSDHTKDTRSGSTTAHANNSLPEGQLFLALDNLIPPGIGNIDYDPEGDIHFLEELLSNDSIPLPKNESSNFDHHDDPSFPCPLLEPPDVEFFFDFEPNSEELIAAVINNIDELIEDECFNPGGELMLDNHYETAQHAQPEDSNKLFQKLLEDLKELAEYIHSPSRDRSIFFNDNEYHSVQYKENLQNSSNSNQEEEKPPQDSKIRQLIIEECCIEVSEDQKQNMENTILELVEICQQKELYCMYDNEVKNVMEQPAGCRTRIEKSLQNFRVIHKNSISLNNTSQMSPVHAIAPILSTKEPEYSPSMGYEHPNTTPEIESDEIIKSGVKELVPILTENEVTSEDKRECDVPVCENSPICDDHSEIFSDSNNDDDISIDNDDFEDIEYVEASLSDPEIRSGNTTTHVDDSLPEYDSFCFEIEPDQERLINVVKNDIFDDLSNDPLLEEADLFLTSDNLIPPGIENFADDSEGDIHFLEALLIDDSNLFPNNESSESDFDNLSFPRPPPKPPDAKFDFKLDSGKEISVVMNTIVKLECLDPRDKFENDDYYSFMFVIYAEMFSFLLSAESEDTIFDPGFTPHRLKLLVFGYLSRSARASHPFFEISLGKSISLISIA
nr:hypothetical protein [Tanacetum cinerariifolium]